MTTGGKKDEMRPIIVKRVKKVAGGHHGGAWKVAYADFVTAMMAFFLLLWLLNVAVDEALQTISHYFDPSYPRISSSESGAGGVLGGLSVAPEGAMVTEVQRLNQPRDTGQAHTGEAREETVDMSQYDQEELARLEEDLRAQEDQRFEEAMQQLQQAIQQSPELAEHLLVDITPEGLRIQIIDREGKPMFPSGSAEMYDRARTLLTEVGKVVRTMPNDASVRGHTDSTPYPPRAKYTNWELSADRANASRRVLMETGVPAAQVANVMGQADRDHLITEDPHDPRNRRITIMMLREEMADAINRGAFGDRTPRPVSNTPRIAPPEPAYQRTPGEVYFP